MLFIFSFHLFPTIHPVLDSFNSVQAAQNLGRTQCWVSVPPLHQSAKGWRLPLKDVRGPKWLFWGGGQGGVESLSVCTHHVQQKRRLIQLIYTMHRVLFTRDIPTEGLSLVLLQSQTGHTQTRTFLGCCCRSPFSA